MSFTDFQRCVSLCLEPYFNQRDVASIIWAYLHWDTLTLYKHTTAVPYLPLSLWELLEHHVFGGMVFSGVTPHICWITLTHNHALIGYDVHKQEVIHRVTMQDIVYPQQIQCYETWLLIRGTNGIEIFEETSLTSQGRLGDESDYHYCYDFTVVPSQQQVYICNTTTNEIVQFDWRSRKKVFCWTSWYPRGIVYHQKHLWVTHDSPSVSCYDLMGTTIKAFGFPGRGPWGRMYTYGEKLLCIHDEGQNSFMLYHVDHMTGLSHIADFKDTLVAFCKVPHVIDEILLLSYQTNCFKQHISTLKIH